MCSNLPTVPEAFDPNEQIESRLLQLKFFNQTWLKNNKTDKEISDDVTRRFEKLQNVAISSSTKDTTEVNGDKIVKSDNIEPVFSTKEDTQNFNQWYYDHISKTSGKTKPKLYDVPSECRLDLNDKMYKQWQNNAEVPEQQNISQTYSDSPSTLCYLQALLMLLIAVHKSLSEKMVEVVNISQSQSPIVSFPCPSKPSSFPIKSVTTASMSCSCTVPPLPCRGCSGRDGTSCMCKLVGRLFTRTVDKLGEVEVMARNCGELFKLPWDKVRQGLFLVVKKMAVRVQNFVSNAVTVLEEMEKK